MTFHHHQLVQCCIFGSQYRSVDSRPTAFAESNTSSDPNRFVGHYYSNKTWLSIMYTVTMVQQKSPLLFLLLVRPFVCVISYLEKC